MYVRVCVCVCVRLLRLRLRSQSQRRSRDEWRRAGAGSSDSSRWTSDDKEEHNDSAVTGRRSESGGREQWPDETAEIALRICVRVKNKNKSKMDKSYEYDGLR